MMNEVTIYLVNGNIVKIKMSDETYSNFAKGYLSETSVISGGRIERIASSNACENGFGGDYRHIAFFTVNPMDAERGE